MHSIRDIVDGMGGAEALVADIVDGNTFTTRRLRKQLRDSLRIGETKTFDPDKVVRYDPSGTRALPTEMLVRASDYDKLLALWREGK